MLNDTQSSRWILGSLSTCTSFSKVCVPLQRCNSSAMHFCAPGAMVPAWPADAWTSAADACAEMPLRCLITWHRLHQAAALMSDLMLHRACRLLPRMFVPSVQSAQSAGCALPCALVYQPRCSLRLFHTASRRLSLLSRCPETVALCNIRSDISAAARCRRCQVIRQRRGISSHASAADVQASAGNAGTIAPGAQKCMADELHLCNGTQTLLEDVQVDREPNIYRDD